jgi:hypothetical protein
MTLLELAPVVETEPVVELKVCLLCRRSAPPVLFAFDRRQPDGRATVCRTCIAASREPECQCEDCAARHYGWGANIKARRQAKRDRAARLEPLPKPKPKPKPKRSHRYCPSGHEFTPTNTYIPPGASHRICKECTRINKRKYAANRTLGRVDDAHRALRAELEDCRAMHVEWTTAWASARQNALGAVPEHERMSMSQCLSRTYRTWQAAYEQGLA